MDLMLDNKAEVYIGIHAIFAHMYIFSSIFICVCLCVCVYAHKHKCTIINKTMDNDEDMV